MNLLYQAHTPLVVAFLLLAALMTGLSWRRR
jgi:hypothetical protein